MHEHIRRTAGGAGFAERGFAQARRGVNATAAAVATCECEDGCPSCVQSPKCGNRNSPLDKAGALTVLALLSRTFDALAEVPAEQFLPEEFAPAPREDGER